MLVEEQGPEVVPALEGIRIQVVAAGGWHSAGISGEKRKKNLVQCIIPVIQNCLKAIEGLSINLGLFLLGPQFHILHNIKQNSCVINSLA